jgi:hypothetical protein
MERSTGVIERDAIGMLLDPTMVVDRNRRGKNDLRSVVAVAAVVYNRSNEGNDRLQLEKEDT